jgi:hypothetical protein
MKFDNYIKEYGSYNYKGKMAKDQEASLEKISDNNYDAKFPENVALKRKTKESASDGLAACKRLMDIIDTLFSRLNCKNTIVTNTELNELDNFRKDLRAIEAFLSNLSHVWSK